MKGSEVMWCKRGQVRGFTLLEVLTVLLVLGVLAAVSLVGYGQVTDRARTTQVQADLRQLSMAAVTQALMDGAEVLSRDLFLQVMEGTGNDVQDGLSAAGWQLGLADEVPTRPGQFTLGFDQGDGLVSDTMGSRAALVTVDGNGVRYAAVATVNGAPVTVVPVTGEQSPAQVLGVAPASPDPLAVSFPLTEMVTVGGVQQLSPVVTGGTGPYTFDVSGALPSGVVFDPVTGVFTSPAASSVGTVSVVAGREHSVALGTDGRVYAWGFNSSGQLGDGTTSPRTEPVEVLLPKDRQWVAVAAGYAHSVALGQDGSVWSWGQQTVSAQQQLVPQQVAGLDGQQVVGVAAGSWFTVAVTADGSVWSWGQNAGARLGRDGGPEPAVVTFPDGVQVKSVFAGDQHAGAVTVDGALYMWGTNTQGQVGDGTRTTRSTPYQVFGPGQVTDAAAGFQHSLAVKTDGSVAAWGYNSGRRLGVSTSTLRLTTPTPVVGLSLSPGARVFAGNEVSFVVTSAGVVWGWGDNTNRHTGLPTRTVYTSPVVVAAAGEVVSLGTSTTYRHTVFATGPGAVLAVGEGGAGQLGRGSTASATSPVGTSLFASPEWVSFTVDVTVTDPTGQASTGPVVVTVAQ